MIGFGRTQDDLEKESQLGFFHKGKTHGDGGLPLSNVSSVTKYPPSRPGDWRHQAHQVPVVPSSHSLSKLSPGTKDRSFPVLRRIRPWLQDLPAASCLGSMMALAMLICPPRKRPIQYPSLPAQNSLSVLSDLAYLARMKDNT